MIELILVMTIIGVLTTVFLATFPASQGRARDTARRNDLKQYQTALETYANRYNGLYPYRDASGIRASDNAGSPSLCNDIGLNTSPNTDCAADPKDNQTACNGSVLCRYFYRSNGGLNTGLPGATVYVIWGAIEKPSVTTNRYFIVCSNGKTGESVNAPISSACPI